MNWKGGVAKLIQHSWELYSETMRLSIWENHLNLFVDFEHYCNVHHCGKLWDQNCHCCRHIKTCKTAVSEVFPWGTYKNPPTVFEKLEEIGICIPQNDRFYPYYCCDFEVYFFRKNISENDPKLTFEARHISLSVGIASNVRVLKKVYVLSQTEGKLN